MINILKKYFTDPNDKEKGWIRLKGYEFARDKQKHLVIGLLIFIVAYVFSFLYPSWEASYGNFHGAIQNAVGITCAFAVGKEVIDLGLHLTGLKKSNGLPIPDFIATVIAPLFVFGILSLLIK